jgi:hypothetical protein
MNQGDSSSRTAATKNCAQKNLILCEWESIPRPQSMVESRQGASGLKAWRGKSILGGRTKIVEENHYPKNKARENLRTSASKQGKRPRAALAGSTGIGLRGRKELGAREDRKQNGAEVGGRKNTQDQTPA